MAYYNDKINDIRSVINLLVKINGELCDEIESLKSRLKEAEDNNRRLSSENENKDSIIQLLKEISSQNDTNRSAIIDTIVDAIRISDVKLDKAVSEIHSANSCISDISGTINEIRMGQDPAPENAPDEPAEETETPAVDNDGTKSENDAETDQKNNGPTDNDWRKNNG